MIFYVSYRSTNNLSCSARDLYTAFLNTSTGSTKSFMNTSTEKGLPKRRACIPCNMVMKISWPGLLLQFLLADNDIRAWVTANSCWHLTGFKPLNLYPSTVPFYHLFLLFLASHGLYSAYFCILLSGLPGSWPSFCLFMYPFVWVTRFMAYILPIYVSFWLGWLGSWPTFCLFMYPFLSGWPGSWLHGMERNNGITAKHDTLFLIAHPARLGLEWENSEKQFSYCCDHFHDFLQR